MYLVYPCRHDGKICYNTEIERCTTQTIWIQVFAPFLYELFFMLIFYFSVVQHIYTQYYTVYT